MDTPVYRVLSMSFRGPSTPIPVSQTPLWVTFTHESGERVEVAGFWDGADRYVVRFCPERMGVWSWTTRSCVDELRDHTGSITVGPAGHGEHGPVRVSDTYHFAHADGTPFRPVGGTVYNWLHQPEPRPTRTVTSLRDAGLNKLRFLLFPQAGDYVEHHPAAMPFARDAEGRWDVSHPDVTFFRRVDRAVQLLASQGIQAELLILNAYDNGTFGFDALTEVEDRTYLSYLIARLSAYPNLWWALCNEFDLLDRPTQRWTRLGRYLARTDPHDHLRSVHNWVTLYDHGQSWVTHASVQLGQATEELGRATLLRDAYRKPVVLDEICYEGDVAERWGRLTGRQLVHRFWVAAVSGCYASHGESYTLADGTLHLVAGGELTGSSPIRLGFLQQVLQEVRGPGLDPVDPWWDADFVAGVPGQEYLQYLGPSAPPTWEFRLPQGRYGPRLEKGDAFTVDIIDTWAMTITAVGRTFRLTDIHRNEAFAEDADPVQLRAGEALAVRVRRSQEMQDPFA